MFEKENKYFPITKKPACQLKWTWSSLYLPEGTTASCHRCKLVPIDYNNFDTFHNLDHKVQERKIMLNGKWPTKENGGSGHCEFCKKIEDVGGFSDRMHHLTIPNLYPKELDSDPNAVVVTPRILEVFMNTTCNLKCTYCSNRFSSQWRADAKKYGDLKNLDGTSMSGYGILENDKNRRMGFEKTLDWIIKNGHELKRLHLLGGETFYQSELQEMLDCLSKIKNKNLELNIVSNLMVKEEVFKNYIEKIRVLIKNRNIGRFDLTASIDGWGAEAEYTRIGLKCHHFEKLFSHAVSQKWMNLYTNIVVSSLTIKSMPTLFDIVNKYRKINPKIENHIGMVIRRPWMHPGIFGKSFWTQDVKKIIDSMPDQSERDLTTKKYMIGTFDQLPNTQDRYQINNLKNFLNQIDKRQNTDWRSVYPHLDI